MEDFIESLGRWATPEQEAAMRTGVRRDVRQRQEQAESEKRGTIITDDDEDEDFDDEDDGDESVALGDGIYGKLGSDADRASTAAAVSPTGGRADADSTDEEVFASDGLGDDLDDFLLDLGLDAGLDDDESEGSGVMTANVLDEGEEDEEPPMEALAASTTSAFGVDDDSDDLVTLGLDGDDDEDELEGAVNTVPLEDFGDSDNLDVEDIFDEGGFDYDDGDFGGGGDVW